MLSSCGASVLPENYWDVYFSINEELLDLIQQNKLGEPSIKSHVINS